MKKIITIILSLSLFISVISVTAPEVTAAASGESSVDTPEDTGINSYPDLSDAEVSNLVHTAMEKYKSHGAICYVIESDDGWSFYGYDRKNDVGVIHPGMPYYPYSWRDIGAEYKLNDWFDFKNRLYYESYFGNNDNIRYNFAVVEKTDVKIDRASYFGDIIDTGEKAFPVADSYTYLGKAWEASLDNKQIMCYRIGVPEDDRTLYQREVNYLPREIYIGIEDGEIYRIDEEWYTAEAKMTTIRMYKTHFTYPDSLKVPKKVADKAVLDTFADVIRDGVAYYSPSLKHSKNKKLWASGLDRNDENEVIKKANIRSSISINNNKYKVEAISAVAFYDERNLKKVTIADGITQIQREAFESCRSLQKIRLADTITKIGRSCFKKCTSLKKINLSKALRSIGKEAFKKCTSLKEIIIEKNIKKIGKNTFSECPELSVITVKNKKMKNYLSSQKGRSFTGLDKKVTIKMN
ncbi:MAG: leucine-rich repeat protein [Eubacterium sp.]|nr:leucine-rich repeat protein [Eubacterium sp.]